jgi:hypothetical protein
MSKLAKHFEQHSTTILAVIIKCRLYYWHDFAPCAYTRSGANLLLQERKFTEFIVSPTSNTIRVKIIPHCAYCHRTCLIITQSRAEAEKCSLQDGSKFKNQIMPSAQPQSAVRTNKWHYLRRTHLSFRWTLPLFCLPNTNHHCLDRSTTFG